MASRGEALQEAIANATEVLRESSRGTRAVRAAAARQASTLLDRISDDAFHVCVAVRLVSGSREDATCWVRLHFGSPAFGVGPDTYDEARVLARLEAALAKPALVARLSDPEDATHSRAARWCAEWGVFGWLVRLNYKGVAPPSTEVVKEYLEQFPAASAGGRSEHHLDQLRREPDARLRWVRHFRRRWWTAYRKLPTGTVLSDAQITEKVPFSGTQIGFPFG